MRRVAAPVAMAGFSRTVSHRVLHADETPVQMLILDALQQWMTLQRQKLPHSSATARALDYSLRRWIALTRFVDDGQLPVDNNWIENQIRPVAIGRNNWLFAGSLRAGQRAAAVMSLVQSARMNGHDPMPTSRMC